MAATAAAARTAPATKGARIIAAPLPRGDAPELIKFGIRKIVAVRRNHST
jgi:hypothetical protein